LNNHDLIRLAITNLANHIKKEISTKTNYVISKPTLVYASTTCRCPLQCRMCNVWERATKRDELSTSQWKSILKDLKNYIGTFHINFGGGEPFIRKDMIEILRFSAELGINTGVVTNGFYITDELAKRIIESGIFNINISLDGMSSDSVDWIRKHNGLYKKVKNGINRLAYYKYERKSDIKIIIKPILFKQNLNEIVDLINWAEKIGINGVNISPLMEWTPECQHMWINDYDRLDNVVDTLIKRKRDGAPILNSINHLNLIKRYYNNPNIVKSRNDRCDVGVSQIFINQVGNVSYCWEFPPIGNIKEGIKSIWKSDNARTIRKQTMNCNKNCVAVCLTKKTLKDKFILFSDLIKRKKKSYKNSPLPIPSRIPNKTSELKSIIKEHG